MKTGIIGATGYAGAELVRLLCGHPKVTSLSLSSVSFEGGQIEEVYPNFLKVTGKTTGKLEKAEEVIAASDVVFSALPHAVGEPYAAACMERKKSFIDLSADFRFDDDEDTYFKWYGIKYRFPDLHKKSIYGLPEMNRQKIKEASSSGSVIIANPGCYPTAASLGVLPAIAKGLNGKSCIIVNAVTGISGGGREPQRSYHYPECADSVSPYKVACHRHTPEIERNISFIGSGGKVKVVFTAHLAPLNRGILATIYIPLAGQTSRDEALKIYADFYKDEPFVRVLPEGLTAATNRVRMSNYCDISIHVDSNTSTLIVISAIDNMVKGAAGQAVQNMNILFGFEETAGLETIPALF